MNMRGSCLYEPSRFLLLCASSLKLAGSQDVQANIFIPPRNTRFAAKKGTAMKQTPELRKDPTSGRWSVVQNPEAPGNRYKKPEDHLARQRDDFEQTSCVFSQQFAGGKRQAKEALFGLRWRDNQVEVTYDNWDRGDWEVMVVRTDYAQVVPERTQVLLGEDPFVAEAGFGVHELIIEDPTENHLPLGVMDVKRTQLILLAVLYRFKGKVKGYPKLDLQQKRDSAKPLLKTEGVRHISFFHNHRKEAGGSQEHPHSQIIASPMIPTEVSAELEYALKRQEQPPRRCVYCEIIEAESAVRDRTPKSQRILFETEHFLAVQPYSSIYPFETWLIPKTHSDSFAKLMTKARREGATHMTALEDLASLINTVVGRLYACLDDPGYNLILKTAPVARADEADKYASFHWHIRIEPRGVTIPAGYELSTGIFTSPTPPEETTSFLQNWGTLGQADSYKDGTLAWYLRLSDQMATDTKLIGELETFKRPSRDDDAEEVTEFERLSRYEPEQAKEIVSYLYERLKDQVQPGAIKSLTGKERFQEERFDTVLAGFVKLLGDRQNGAPNIRQGEIARLVLCAQTVLAALKRAPTTLRNIITILDRSARDLKGAAIANAWLREVQSSKPGLFLTQSEPPSESVQRLQPVSQAGGYDGPHYRRCPSTGRWVLIPSKMRRKPAAALKEDQLKRTGPDWLPLDSEEHCQFCRATDRVQNELILGVKRASNQWVAKRTESWQEYDDEWHCYVIKNIDPVFSRIGRGVNPLITGVGPFESIDGLGISDVIVIGCNTSKILKDGRHHYPECVSQDYLGSAFVALCSRIIDVDIRKDYRSLRHLAIFSNHRGEAGGRVSHVNWQLVVSPIVPTGVERELEHGRRYFEEYFGRCCFCDMIQAEEAHTKEVKGKDSEIDRGEMLGGRIVSEEKEKDFIVLAPYASRSPFEVWIMPRKHVSRIEESLIERNQINMAVIQTLATTLSETLLMLYESLGDPGYSMLIQNAPFALEGYEHLYRHYHWRIIIETHKLAIAAGYEHLTGIWSNVVPPEKAAEELCHRRK